jgi:ATP-dependent DNA helicase RecQ
LLNVIKDGKHNFRSEQVVNVLIANETSILRTFEAFKLKGWGKGKEKPKGYWTNLISQISMKHLIKKDIEKYGILSIDPKGENFLNSNQKYYANPFIELTESQSQDNLRQNNSVLDPELLKKLQALNKNLARERNIPPYAMFSEISLNEMASTYPFNEEELMVIPGVGEGKAKRFGASLILEIKNHCLENNIERLEDFTMRSAVQKGSLKIYIIQSIDRLLSIEEMAQNKGLSQDEIIDEMQRIVENGTRLNLDPVINDMIGDDECVDEIMDYFQEESESGDIREALKYFDESYSEEELRLVRLKFLCKVL